MSCPAMTTWLFGKIPSRGDFVCRGIDTTMRESIDDWLSAEMAAARTAHGDDFDARYDSAPAWTFVHAGEDGRWSAGALCASQDSAGRRYPLIIGTHAGGPADAAHLAVGCLSVLGEAFGEGWDADAIASARPAPEQAPGWQPGHSQWSLLAEDGPAVTIDGQFPQGVITAMMEWPQ